MVLTGLAQRGGRAVPRGVHSSRNSRRLSARDVEVEGERRRSARRDRQIRGRCVAVRPGLYHDRNARRADAGRVRVSALRRAHRTDKRTASLPRVPCKQCGKEFSTQWASKPDDFGIAARRWSASGSNWRGISATKCGTPPGYAAEPRRLYSGPVGAVELASARIAGCLQSARPRRPGGDRRLDVYASPTRRDCCTSSLGTSSAAFTWRWSRTGCRMVNKQSVSSPTCWRRLLLNICTR